MAQELQQQASSASKAREAAEADLAQLKSKGADIQRKACPQLFYLLDTAMPQSFPEHQAQQLDGIPLVLLLQHGSRDATILSRQD